MTNLNIKQNVGSIKQSVDVDISKQIKESDINDIAHLAAYIVDLKKTQDATHFITKDKNDKSYYNKVENNILSEILPKASQNEMEFPQISVEYLKMAAILTKYKNPDFIREVVSKLNFLGEKTIQEENADPLEVTKKIAQAVTLITTEYPGFTIGAKVFVDSESGLDNKETVNILPALLHADKTAIMTLLSEMKNYVKDNNFKEDVSLFDSRNMLLGIADIDESAMGSCFADAVYFAKDDIFDNEDYVDITINNVDEVISVLSNLRPDAIEYVQEVAPNILKALNGRENKKSNQLDM